MKTLILIATILSWHDGDTVKVDLDCDINTLCKAINVRISHIDAPEIYGNVLKNL